MSTYKVKEIFYTLQGEGARTGRPAVFLRFTGCNLWNGREEDRHKAICRFCDTDFRGTDGINGGKYASPQDLAQTVHSLWPDNQLSQKYVVCTGGEPMLQLDEPLIKSLHKKGFEVAIETNGTLEVPDAIDWICVSPKANTKLVQTSGNELKLVYPQEGIDPAQFESLDFDHFYLQPMDGPFLDEFTDQAVDYSLCNPSWKLSIQTHKLLHIP